MDHSTNWRVDRPRDVVTALQGLTYPAPRGKVIEQARSNGVAPELMQQLLRIPESADFRTQEQLQSVLDELQIR